MIIAVEGPEGAGKTHWALTAPGPIYFHNFDNGLEGVRGRFADKEVNEYNHAVERVGISDPRVLRDQADNAVEAICQSLRLGRSVVVDKADQLWALLSLGYEGETFEKRQDAYQRIIRHAYNSDANLIMLHGIRVIFAKNSAGQSYPSGDMTCAGWDGTRSAVQLSFATRFSGNGYQFNTSNGRWVQSNGAAQAGQFEQTIIKSRDNVQLVGQMFANTDFAMLCGMACPDVDWSK
jgi:hypothetical protein